MPCPLSARTLTAVLAALSVAAGCSDKPEPARVAPGTSTGIPGGFNPPEVASVVSGHQVTVRVLLGQAVAGKVNRGDTVLIYARAPGANGQMVALVKRSAAELPLTVTLDDSASLNANQRLSGLSTVVIGALVSKHGDLNPRPGDLEGNTAPIPVTVKETVVVAINRQH